MIKHRILLLAVIALVICSTAVFADDDPTYKDITVTSAWPVIDGTCTYDRGESIWGYTEPGLVIERLNGCNPPVGSDPRVRQTILNQTSDVWTDWHVDITNGTGLRNVFVRKTWEANDGTPYGVVLPWVIQISETGCGFLAHVNTSGNPNNPEAVRLGDKLYVEFTYDVAGTPVTVTQYPTTDWAIPEPSSVLALAVGIVGMLGSIRRFKK